MLARLFATKMVERINQAVGEKDYTSTTPDQIGKVISEVITEFIIDHTTIQLSYSGIIPPGSPDPITTDSAEVMGTCPQIIGRDFNTWVRSIESGISTGFYISRGQIGVTPISPTLIFTPGLELSQSKILDKHLGQTTDPQLLVWECIGEEIINWLESVPTVMYPASTNVSTGVASTLKIIMQ